MLARCVFSFLQAKLLLCCRQSSRLCRLLSGPCLCGIEQKTNERETFVTTLIDCLVDSCSKLMVSVCLPAYFQKMASCFLKRMATASQTDTHWWRTHSEHPRFNACSDFPTLLEQVDEFNLMGIPLKPVQDTVALTRVWSAAKYAHFNWTWWQIRAREQLFAEIFTGKTSL